MTDAYMEERKNNLKDRGYGVMSRRQTGSLLSGLSAPYYFLPLHLSHFPPITSIVYPCLLFSSPLLNLFQDFLALWLIGHMQLSVLSSKLWGKQSFAPSSSLTVRPPSLYTPPLPDQSILHTRALAVCMRVSFAISMTTSTGKPPLPARFHSFAFHLHVSRATGGIWLWQWQRNWHDPVHFCLSPLFQCVPLLLHAAFGRLTSQLNLRSSLFPFFLPLSIPIMVSDRMAFFLSRPPSLAAVVKTHRFHFANCDVASSLSVSLICKHFSSFVFHPSLSLHPSERRSNCKSFIAPLNKSHTCSLFV